MSKPKGSLLEIFKASTKLGFTSFGGPVAHLAYFKDEYIDRKKWLDDKTYADIIALCQFLPGPASSQVGIAIGMLRGGLLGGIISWIGFTVPSIIVLVLFALLYQSFDLADANFIHSLKVVAAAVVLHALIGLGKKADAGSSSDCHSVGVRPYITSLSICLDAVINHSRCWVIRLENVFKYGGI
ncbi:chromate transporter [Halobacillus litoralis]|nr:chromate transporter [Halobacillus litoralis]WLR48318.1 chromate transporter [Halobacillus litoralis]